MSSSDLNGEPEMLRGASFVHSYSSTSFASTDTSMDISFDSQRMSATSSEASTSAVAAVADDSTSSSTKLKRREPTMLRTGAILIAPPEAHGKRYTIVLDLDETVVYARDGPLYARAHLQSLLQVMDKYCEVIVWTAGERKYAKAILEEINTDGIIKHLVYRHRTWFNPKDYTKELHRLGRDMNYVLIIENTPDCVRANPQNGIIVEDFEGIPAAPEITSPKKKPQTPPPSPGLTSKKKVEEDHTFVHLMRLVEDLGRSGDPVPQFLARCSLLRRQMVVASNGDEIPIFYLPSKKQRAPRQSKSGTPTLPIVSSAGGASSSGVAPESLDVKVVKTNRDKVVTITPPPPTDVAGDLSFPTTPTTTAASTEGTASETPRSQPATEQTPKRAKRTREESTA